MAQFQRKGYKKNYTNNEKTTEDFGRFSLWFVDNDYPSETCVATGVCNVVINGEEHTLRMFMHQTKSKASGKSPDLFGFIKLDKPNPFKKELPVEKPVKKKLQKAELPWEEDKVVEVEEEEEDTPHMYEEDDSLEDDEDETLQY